ncbi:cysteine desulfurase family protein, partial [Planctomycetota bacterium]|nr:cysteine desulfurase family protein [Planctomycetota bacterium]
QSKMIDFDQNATTPVDEAVLEELIRATREYYGNTSSGHILGAKAGKHLEDCRARVAAVLNIELPEEVVFTSGGTESDNAAIRGIGRAVREDQHRDHLITCAIEHRAVLAPCEWLKKWGFGLFIMSVDEYGEIDLEEYLSSVSSRTALVSVMLANNEIGTIQPIRKLVDIAHKNGAYFHTDAVQAMGKIKIDVQELGVDSLSLSAHKFYGPKGVGLMYLKKGTPYRTYMLGGTHENNQRGGTVALPQISAMTLALELAEKKRAEKADALMVLRNDLTRQVLAKIEGSHLNGKRENCTPNTASIRFDGVHGAKLLKRMSEEGLLASAGSACMWDTPKPSHVLTALGLTDEQGAGTIRFSLGYANTTDEVTQVVELMDRLVKEQRAG